MTDEHEPGPIIKEASDEAAVSLVMITVIVCHAVVFAVLIVVALLLHHLLERTGDPKLYDWIPWRWVVDTADLGLVFALIVYGTGSFIHVLKLKRRRKQ